MSNKIKETVEFKLKVDRKSKVTLTDQITGYIRMKISRGDWVTGQKLPSQRKLAETLGVNRSTIVDIYSELISLGIIEGKYGRGTEIVNNTWALMFSEKTPEWNKYIESGIHKANQPIIQTINRLEFDNSITRLSTGEMAPSLFPHDMMKKVLSKIPARAFSLNYLEPLGLLELRKALSQYLKIYGLDIRPSELLIVSGSLQALQLISVSILKPGSTVFAEEPSYVNSLRVFESNGMNMKGIPMDRRGMMPWRVDSDKSVDSIMYTIPTFHNPTGIVMTEGRRKEVLDWCNSHRMPLIEDDAYRELWIDDLPPKPIKTMDSTGNVLYLGTVSKSLAPGLRIGWVAGPEAVVERLGDIKMQTDYGASSLSQWALTEWIESGMYSEHLISFRKSLETRRDYILGVLDKYYNGLADWNKPEGGYYIWLRLKDKINMEKLFLKSLEEKLLINPGIIYSLKSNRNIRLSYSYTDLEELEKGLVKLAGLISEMI